MSRCPWEHTFKDGKHARCLLPENHTGSHCCIVFEKKTRVVTRRPKIPYVELVEIPVIREWTE